MKQIRNNVFETNSSSTHSMVVGTDMQFQLWELGEIFYVANDWGHEYDLASYVFVTKEEILAAKDSINETIQEYDPEYDKFSGKFDDKDIAALSKMGIYTKDAYELNHSECLETSEYSYTTPGGEVVRMLCEYGYDG